MFEQNNYYNATSMAPALPTLEDRLECEVCVIGGGFAGLNTALGLNERGINDVLVLEAHTPAYGASGRNGGFVFGGFSRGAGKLLNDLGPSAASQLYRGTLDAIERIRHRIKQYNIECDAVYEGVVLANWFEDKRVLKEHQDMLHTHFSHDLQWMEREKMANLIHTERYHEGLFEPNAFHFHPLKYAYGLVKVAQNFGTKLFSNSPATSLTRTHSGWFVTTPNGSVQAKHVVLACGGYLAGLNKNIDASVLPIATYVMTTEPLKERMSDVLHTQAAIYDTRFAFDYYRPLADTRLLWGGRISVRDRSPQDVSNVLYNDLMKVFPQLEGVQIDYAWSGLMSYARHEMPQIGLIEPGLWMAQAFGGHGVGPTTLAGEIVAAGIAENDMRWKEFSTYGLVSAAKPFGFAAAQLSYWWAQFKDAFKDKMEKL